MIQPVYMFLGRESTGPKNHSNSGHFAKQLVSDKESGSNKDLIKTVSYLEQHPGAFADVFPPLLGIMVVLETELPHPLPQLALFPNRLVLGKELGFGNGSLCLHPRPVPLVTLAREFLLLGFSFSLLS